MDRQDVLINKLIDNHIYKLPDNRDLFEGSCEELAELLERDGKNETHTQQTNRKGHER
ncbi:Fur-regulated basic protein FbpA [Bacillus cereus]|uniref:Fur-regulated basic protein FbpA n=1 Tax=Bacillus cereus TaxID=1396 RepID=UPI000BF45F4E|nr:Fur-regulated basic protein FbpA [Bacillus cereus]PFI14600.1 Fur-regulated basic protein FbpA [Bacillus cereus]